MTIMIITVYLIKLRQLFELQRYQYRKYYKISNWILHSRPIYFYDNIYIFLFKKIIISTLLFFKLDLLFVFPLWIWNWFKKGAFMVYLNRFLISKNNITLTADWAWSVEVSHCLSVSTAPVSVAYTQMGQPASSSLYVPRKAGCSVKSGLSHYLVFHREVRSPHLFYSSSARPIDVSG